MKVGFISLGCPKNLVDTEMVIGLFKDNGFEIVNDVKRAQIIVINTCGFIESAKQESINTILEIAEYKKTKNCKYLIVIGCLVQRYKDELKKAIPEVDLFITLDEYKKFWNMISTFLHLKNNNRTNKLCYMNRIISTGDKTAYLKISEGCNNKCTYCAIPLIRGPYISRPIEDILEEAKTLSRSGIKEIILVAQDTTKYGEDLYGQPRLSELLNELCKIEGIKWIRFLYSYPESITDELINLVKNNDKICNYFDIPIQHISDKILKRMNRRITAKEIKKLIEKIKLQIPDVILRTSLIVGFPGETEEDFNELYNFVAKGYFDRLGIFMYSKEDKTPAAKLENQVHYNTKKKRYNLIMNLARALSKKKLKMHIGKIYEVLIENITLDKKFYIGRSCMDIPDVDGLIIIKNTKDKMIGKFINCKIVDVKDYDLVGEIEDSGKEGVRDYLTY